VTNEIEEKWKKTVVAYYRYYPSICSRDGGGVEFNSLNAELNPICHLLALFGAYHILHVSRIRVKSDLPSAGIISSSPYSPR